MSRQWREEYDFEHAYDRGRDIGFAEGLVEARRLIDSQLKEMKENGRIPKDMPDLW